MQYESHMDSIHMTLMGFVMDSLSPGISRVFDWVQDQETGAEIDSLGSDQVTEFSYTFLALSSHLHGHKLGYT